MNNLESQLEELYYKQGKSWKTIKEILKISSRTLKKYKQQFSFKSRSTEERIEATKKTNLKRYGCTNPMQNPLIQAKAKDTIKREGVVEKRKQTCLEKYGVEIPSQNQQVKEKMYKTNEERYGSYCSCNNPEVKAKISKRVREAFATGVPKQREYDTRRKNHSFNLSNQEEQAYTILLEYFSEEDVIRQHKTAEYPFNCDFYIKSLDLYLEFQGSWVHGHCPFDSYNETHQKLVQKWKEKDTEYFSYAIEVWTIRDPEKRRIAKENNLNWKEFFSLEELREWLFNL